MMRIRRFHLERFAMFTNTTLELVPHGVNVILGANEAGKSTTQSAIAQLLFGIPVRSPHNWKHQNRDLRLGATLVEGPEAELDVVRLKREKDSLRTPADEPLSESVMTRWLGGVDQTTYHNLFSISHDEIVAGGRALLRSDGDVGGALFGAGAGLPRLHQIRAELDEQIDKLFKPSGRKQLIHEAIKRYDDHEKNVQEASQSAAAVEKLRNALESLEQQRHELDEQISVVKADVASLGRVKAVARLIGERRYYEGELRTRRAAGPLVPLNLAQNFDDAVEAERAATVEQARLERERQAFHDRLEARRVNDAVLAQGDEIHRLVAGTEAYAHRRTDLEAKRQQRIAKDAELRRAAAQLPPSLRGRTDAGSPLHIVEQEQLQRLINEHDELVRTRTQRAEQFADDERLRREAEGARQALPPRIDIRPLQDVLERFQNHGSIEEAHVSLTARQQAQRERLEAGVHKLGLVMPPDQIDRLRLPEPTVVDRLDQAVQDAARRVGEGERDLQQTESDLAGTVAELEALLSDSNPPSEQELMEARARRDAMWETLRVGGPLETMAGTDHTPRLRAEEQFWAAMGDADAIADRLRHESETVERRRSLEESRDSHEQRRDRFRGHLEAARAAHRAALDAWEQCWAHLGVAVGDRRHMDSIAAEITALVQVLADHRSIKIDIAETEHQLRTAQREIIAVLQSTITASPTDSTTGIDVVPGVELGRDLDAMSLGQLIAALKRELDEAQQNLQRHVIAQNELDSVTARHDKSSADFAQIEIQWDRWQQQWTALLEGLGLSSTVTPADAESLIVVCRQIETLGSELIALDQQIHAHTEAIAATEQSVAAVVEACGGTMRDGSDVLPVIADLHAQLNESVGQDEARRAVMEQLEDNAQSIDAVVPVIAEARAIIATTVSAAGLASVEEMQEAVGRSREADELSKRIAQITQDLVSDHALPIDELEAEYDARRDLDFETELGRRQHEQEELEQQRVVLDQQIGTQRAELGRLDASDQAALWAEAAQQELAGIVRDTEEFVRLSLARELLEREIEAYRERHQGPIVARASAVFAALSAGRYGGIDIDAAPNGDAAISALRPDGTSVESDRLSTGTADQLYLALRLAALEQYVSGGTALPLILDDLFVHFDDERTLAGFGVLETLVPTVQVVLFTHHERVAELAAQGVRRERLNVIRLGPS